MGPSTLQTIEGAHQRHGHSAEEGARDCVLGGRHRWSRTLAVYSSEVPEQCAKNGTHDCQAHYQFSGCDPRLSTSSFIRRPQPLGAILAGGAAFSVLQSRSDTIQIRRRDSGASTERAIHVRYLYAV